MEFLLKRFQGTRSSALESLKTTVLNKFECVKMKFKNYCVKSIL